MDGSSEVMRMTGRVQRWQATQRQQGVSLLSLLLLIVILVPLVMSAIRLVPIYVDHNFVVSITRSVLDTQRVGLSQAQLRQDVAESLRINNIRDFDTRAITLNQIGGRPIARINYERRVTLVGNIDFVVSFDETVE